MRIYENYHTHKDGTNIIIADSPCKYKEYINRAIELKQTVITSVEHGWQGDYFLLNEMIRKKNVEFEKRRRKGESNVPENLKFIFGTEAYFVKDRHEQDRSNCHLILLAKTDKGRKAINLALSIANEDGMYNGRARLDFELIFNLPKDDVFITTACVGYWNKYDDIDEITLKFKQYFGDNFYLEVQNHNTDKQKQINKHIIELSYKYGIDIIAGMDTHVIDESDLRRDVILKYKKINYNDEEGWYLDYPTYDTAFNRFKQQGILTDEEILRALENTNIIKTFDDIDLGLKTIITENKIYLDVEVKLPTMYKDWTQEQKDVEFKRILNYEWNIFKDKENIPKEEYSMYLEGIRYEANEVITTGMTDYFLIHYYGLKSGKKKGGRVTKRGRGSAVGFFINTLLGFSKVDRFKAPIKLYPERFLTAERILGTKAIPDIDNNVDDQVPFVEAFKEILGEHGIYPMIAFGTLKKSSAIKLYMGAEGIEAEIQNEVSKQLKEYDNVIKHCETESEKEQININDYISEEYSKYVELSKPYQGIIIQKSAHPCAFLLLNGDIREEIGLIRCESKSTKKSVLTTCIDGTMADHYKYLKTDLLIVDVVGITEDIWERIGEESISNNKLEKLLASDEGSKAWDIYAQGLTLCVNQCEQEGTKNKCMKYKMQNTAELSAFVAGVRPAFASLLPNFLNRKAYTTGVEALDEVLKDSYHYMLYQESIMAFLNWLGVDMKDTYDIVKKISKKIYLEHPEQMEELKCICKPEWNKKVGNLDKFEETWKVMNDAGAYAFNSAHSYCVGNDGAEIAYLKAYYPYETYEVCLNRFDEKANKDKVALLKKEMKHFGINEGELRFGLDNRKFNLDKKNKCINPSLSSIKKMGKLVADDLYKLSQENTYDNFYELLKDIKTKTSTNSTMLDILINIDYFKDFGTIGRLKTFVEYYDLLEGKKAPKKNTIETKVDDKGVIALIDNCSTPTASTYSKFDSEKCLKLIWEYIPEKDLKLIDKIKKRKEMLGYIDYINDKVDKNYVIITEVNDKYTPVVEIFSLGNGNTCKLKISKPLFRDNPIKPNDVIYIHDLQKKFGFKKVGTKADGKPKFEEDRTTFAWWIKSYSIVNDIEIN